MPSTSFKGLHLWALCAVNGLIAAKGFSFAEPTTHELYTVTSKSVTPPAAFFARFDDDTRSDYGTEDLVKNKVKVGINDDDAAIRDALKRELLLLSSVTNRGECANKEEQNILVDLVNQLEALNPTAEPAFKCGGEWSLCLSSTQLFRTSPFFQSIRVAVGDDNKHLADNGFELHDRATIGSRVGRVRQSISSDKLISKVELDTGIPLLPFRIKGTVVTTARLRVCSSEMWELEISNTQVTGFNVPLLNQFLEDLKAEFPVGDLYKTLQGKIPLVTMKTFYVDEGIRITRDVDDNFFVFSRV